MLRFTTHQSKVKSPKLRAIAVPAAAFDLFDFGLSTVATKGSA